MTKTITKAQTTKMTNLPTWSAKIRYLSSLGMKNGAIAKQLGKRPQHVREVLITPVKNPRV